MPATPPLPRISVSTVVDAPISAVWAAYTQPDHITQWNFASPAWCCPAARNDVEPGGAFSWRMEAKDGSMGFDFEGTYTAVDAPHRLESRLGDGRAVSISFKEAGSTTEVEQSFEIEDQNGAEQQRAGWQAILDNFKAHVERGP